MLLNSTAFTARRSLAQKSRKRVQTIRVLFLPYSAFNLEEPLLCFVVNKYVLCSEKVIIVAIGLKFAMSVHTSFRSVCRKSGLIMLVDSKVVAACVPGIGLQL